MIRATAKKPSPSGELFADSLSKALNEIQMAPVNGNRELPMLEGLGGPGAASFTAPPDNVVLATVDILLDSGKVFTFGNSVVAEFSDFEGSSRLRNLSAEHVIEAGAEYHLANFFNCRVGQEVFPPPKWFTHHLLNSELLPRRLPRIRHYASRPMFDLNFVLRGPGWHPEVGMLIHGPVIEPCMVVPSSGGEAINRLPPALRNLLSGFCFKDSADFANTVGALLTGLLTNHFGTALKGIFLVDGNQPGLGKTLLVRVMGQVLDGTETPVIAFTSDDEELQKRLCAEFRHGGHSVVLLDNGKTANGSPVSSAVIEANSMAPEMSFRVLGKSEILKRPNDKIWAVTMNTTKVSPDLMSRGVPIQLAYDGKPEDRSFTGPDPIRYARDHRVELLGELAGMVVRWNQAGRPAGTAKHRCHEWAGIIGGILKVAGFSEFLANHGEAAASFNLQLESLAALAEAVIAMKGPVRALPPIGPVQQQHAVAGPGKLPAGDWLQFFQRGGVLAKELEAATSTRAKSIRIGQFLSPAVNREVSVQVQGRNGRAHLRVEEGRSNSKEYWFDVAWDDPPEACDSVPTQNLAVNPAVEGGPSAAAADNSSVRAPTLSGTASPAPTPQNDQVRPQAASGNVEAW